MFEIVYTTGIDTATHTMHVHGCRNEKEARSYIEQARPEWAVVSVTGIEAGHKQVTNVKEST